jgi:cell division protein FtsW (lipid II flippase)
MKILRISFWVLFVAGCNYLTGWLFAGIGTRSTNSDLSLISLFIFVSVGGAIWMLYVSIRFEDKPLPFMILALIPYAFVGYRFERSPRIKWRKESLIHDKQSYGSILLFFLSVFFIIPGIILVATSPTLGDAIIYFLTYIFLYLFLEFRASWP